MYSDKLLILKKGNIINDIKMKILSWDIGIKNLSFCIIESETSKIIEWEAIDIAKGRDIKKEKYEIFEDIPRVLDTFSYFKDVSIVLIENQPCLQNPTMKTVQIIIYTYFLINGFHANDSKNRKGTICFCKK